MSKFEIWNSGIPIHLLFNIINYNVKFSRFENYYTIYHLETLNIILIVLFIIKY